MSCEPASVHRLFSSSCLIVQMTLFVFYLLNKQQLSSQLCGCRWIIDSDTRSHHSHLCGSSCGLSSGNSWCKLFYTLHNRTCGSASSWCLVNLDRRAPSLSPIWEKKRWSQNSGSPQNTWTHFNMSAYVPHQTVNSGCFPPKPCGKSPNIWIGNISQGIFITTA